MRSAWLIGACFLISCAATGRASSPDATDWTTFDRHRPHVRLHGVWQDVSRGHLMRVRDDGVDIWHQLDGVCTPDPGLIPPFTIYRLGEGDALRVASYDYRARPELLMAPTLYRRVETAGSACDGFEAAVEVDPKGVVDLTWRLFDRFYAGFERRGVDWSAMRKSYLPRVRAVDAAEDVFDVLADMLRSLNDGHVNLSMGKRHFNASVPRLRARLTKQWNADASGLTERAFVSRWNQRVTDAIDALIDPGTKRSGAAGALVWGRIGRSGYLRIGRFGRFAKPEVPRPAQLDEAEATMRQVFADFGRVDHLILDVSRNGGGHDAAAMLIAGLFADRVRPVLTYNTRQGRSALLKLFPSEETWTRPVTLITSEVTASAAEAFVLAMRTLPHVKHVGEPTRGALSGLLPKPLPNGMMVTIAFQDIVSADGGAFEGVGIPPMLPMAVFPDDDLYGGAAALIRRLAIGDAQGQPTGEI